MLRVSIGAPHQVIFVPSSTNLDKNMAKLPIGWSSSTDLHENLYHLFACRANALCRKQISTAEKDYRVETRHGSTRVLGHAFLA